MTVNLGGVIACSHTIQLEGLAEIASLTDGDIDCGGWCGAEGDVMEDGWTRYLFYFVWKVIHHNQIDSQVSTPEICLTALSR
jgi:hypothetical protein